MTTKEIGKTKEGNKSFAIFFANVDAQNFISGNNYVFRTGLKLYNKLDQL